MWQAFLSNAASQSAQGGSDYSQGNDMGGPSAARDAYDASLRLAESASLNTPIHVMPIGVNLGSVMQPYIEPEANGGLGLNPGTRLSTLYSMLGQSRESEPYIFDDKTKSSMPVYLIAGIGFVFMIMFALLLRR